MVKAEAGFSEFTRGSGLPTCEPLSLVLTRREARGSLPRDGRLPRAAGSWEGVNALHCGSRAHEVKAITEGLFEAKAANWQTERSSI